MAINQWQLCRFTVEGTLFEQACQNVFWYAASNALNELTFARAIRKQWRTVMSYLSVHYEVSRYRLEPLIRTECVVANAGEENAALRFIRPIFSGKVILAGDTSDHGDQTGANDAYVLPSFVSLSVTKSIGQTVQVVDEDGTITNTPSAYPARAGSCRISGLREIETQDAQGNRLKASFQETWNTIVQNLCTITTQADGTPLGATIYQYLLSMRHPAYTATGGWRIFQGDPAQEDPTTWLPAIAASPVVTMSVSEFVTSQGTRVQRRRFN